MWLQEWERWCRGAVTFRAEGGLCERFLNLLTRGEAAVPLWHVVRTPHAVTATMRAADYAALRKQLRAFHPDECHDRCKDPAYVVAEKAIHADLDAYAAKHLATTAKRFEGRAPEFVDAAYTETYKL